MSEEIIRKRDDGERKIIPNGNPRIVSRGRIGALVEFPVLVDQGNGYVSKMFEKYVRPPGTRIIAIKDKKIFLQKEYRLETEAEFDWRLPGGKVFDSFDDYEPYLNQDISDEVVLRAAERELKEEAQLEATDFTIFKKSVCGTTISWDLYYIIATSVRETTHTHNEGEEIADTGWFSYDEVLKMCLDGSINEDRSIGALYQFIQGAGL